ARGDGGGRVPGQVQAVGREGQGASPATLVADPGGGRLRFAQVREGAGDLAERREGVAQIEADVDRLRARGVGGGKLCEGGEGLLEVRGRLPVRRARERPSSRRPQVAGGLAPFLSVDRVPGELLAVGVEGLAV